jgi:hypothetical protein
MVRLQRVTRMGRFFFITGQRAKCSERYRVIPDE